MVACSKDSTSIDGEGGSILGTLHRQKQVVGCAKALIQSQST